MESRIECAEALNAENGLPDWVTASTRCADAGWLMQTMSAQPNRALCTQTREGSRGEVGLFSPMGPWGRFVPQEPVQIDCRHASPQFKHGQPFGASRRRTASSLTRFR